jgi:glucokinase
LEDDLEAVALVAEFANWVAIGLGGLVSLLDPEIIVLGGGLTPFGVHFVQQVQDSLAGHVVGGHFRPEVPVVLAKLGPAAGAIGGALSASALLNPSSRSSGGVPDDSA